MGTVARQSWAFQGEGKAADEGEVKKADGLDLSSGAFCVLLTHTLSESAGDLAWEIGEARGDSQDFNNKVCL